MYVLESCGSLGACTMSKRQPFDDQHVNACLKKDRHSTEELAEEAIQRIRAHGRRVKLYIYYCDNCLGFHLTSTKRGIT